MRGIWDFLKTTAAGGLFVILPVMLLYLVLAEAADLIVVLAKPITDLVFGVDLSQTLFPTLFAGLLILGASFAAGLAMRSRTGVALGRWFEHRVLSKVPMYGVLKGLTAALSRAEEGGPFRPALLESPDGSAELAYVIEDLNDGRLTVLLPWAPTPFAGSLKVVPKEGVRVLDVPLADFTRVLSQLGVGGVDLVPPWGGTPTPDGPSE